MNARDSDQYRQLLLAKRREIEAGAIGTLGPAGGPGERRADVIDQATEAAQADLQVHSHQTDSRLLRVALFHLQTPLRVARMGEHGMYFAHAEGGFQKTMSQHVRCRIALVSSDSSPNTLIALAVGRMSNSILRRSASSFTSFITGKLP